MNEQALSRAPLLAATDQQTRTLLTSVRTTPPTNHLQLLPRHALPGDVQARRRRRRQPIARARAGRVQPRHQGVCAGVVLRSVVCWSCAALLSAHQAEEGFRLCPFDAPRRRCRRDHASAVLSNARTATHDTSTHPNNIKTKDLPRQPARDRARARQGEAEQRGDGDVLGIDHLPRGV